MRGKLAISYPHMGDYSVAFTQVLRHLFPGQMVFPAPAMTKKTIELGSRHSPDFVCSPFKYNMGNYIESLELGANVLFQTGMGCRYGYYGELQEQILRDLGYHFRFACLSRERSRPAAAYAILRELGCTLPIHKIGYALLLVAESIRIMDRYEYYMRENIGFEAVPGSLEAFRWQLLREIQEVDSLQDLKTVRASCSEALNNLKIDKPQKPLRVGIIGDLYTLMEPFSNFYIEKQLAKNNISVSRVMSVWFLLFGKSDAKSLKNTDGYLRYTVGANGVDSVAQCKQYADMGYDGIIHMKSFGCIPELNAMPALMNLSHDLQIPILHMSFDSHTSETGIQTRLEAFSDMIRMRRDGADGKNGKSGTA